MSPDLNYYEDLEDRDPWEFLKNANQIPPGHSIIMAPEFGWPYTQIVNLVSGYAASQRNPCPFINTYGWEDKVLPKYAIETIQTMVENEWIDQVKVFAMTEKAFTTLQRELTDYGIRDLTVTLEKEIPKYSFDIVSKWTFSFVQDYWNNTDRFIIAYEEPLSTYLSAILNAPLLPIYYENQHLPSEYTPLLENCSEVYVIVHKREIEENWKTNWIISDLQSLKGNDLNIISGDMIEISLKIAEVSVKNICHPSRERIMFFSGMNEIALLNPLLASLKGLVLRCGYNNYDYRVKDFIDKLTIDKVVITEAPDKIQGEDLEAWYYISIATRRYIEQILGKENVYRLWANKLKRDITELMQKYNSLDTTTHILYWEIERNILKTLFQI